jgi:NAD(P)-dependent dehydrogenase (short-subunit alcohol dehydrogenase family)
MDRREAMPATQTTGDQTSMSGKTCLVTGATSGIGEVTAHALAGRGATVIVVGRNRERTEAAVRMIVQQTGVPSGSRSVEPMLADLSSQQDIRRLAQEVTSRHQYLHVLVNNAGALILSREKTVDGIAPMFALNHLSYFLLTMLLLDTLKRSAPARIVNVASDAHKGAKLDFINPANTTGIVTYGQSKLANILFTYELARRLEGTGVTVNTLHPGVVGTNFAANINPLVRLVKPLVNKAMLSPQEGAQTSIYLATSPEVEGVTGKYFVKKKAESSSPASYDTAAARRLWDMSAAMTGLVAAG